MTVRFMTVWLCGVGQGERPSETNPTQGRCSATPFASAVLNQLSASQCPFWSSWIQVEALEISF